MATHGQALDVVSFYYDIVSAAAHGRHMIFDVPFAAPLDVCGSCLKWPLRGSDGGDSAAGVGPGHCLESRFK